MDLKQTGDFPTPQAPADRRHHGHHQHPFETLTKEEVLVMKECNRESFYYRSLPLSAILSAATYAAGEAGYIKKHPAWGVSGKMVAAAVVGYFIGKFSYLKVCQQKLLNVPNGVFARNYRKQRGLPWQEPQLSTQAGWEASPTTAAAATRPELIVSSFDLDSNIPHSDTVSDFPRPSTLDDVTFQEESSTTVIPPLTKTYDELRYQNRQQYELDRNRPYTVPSSYDSPQPGLPPSAAAKPPPEPITRRPKNKYGDDFE